MMTQGRLSRFAAFGAALAMGTLLLTGCSEDPRCPSLPGGAVYCLQATGAVPAFEALQDVRIRRNELDERMIVQLEVDAASMRLAGLTPMGQRIFDTRFDNREATSDSVAGDRFDPRVLLALVQLGAWPLDQVALGLASDVRIEDTVAVRRFLRNDATLLEVSRTGSPPRYETLEIRVPVADLTVTIETIDEND